MIAHPFDRRLFVMSKPIWIVPVLTLWMMTGCGEQSLQSAALPTHPTTGQLTINGVPVKGAIVRLFPVAPAAEGSSPIVPTGTVREDGTFELTSYVTGDGAPQGDYLITLEWPDPSLVSSRDAMPGDAPDRLKHRFFNPERSKLKAHIAAGENRLEPIVLENVSLLPGSSLK